MPRVSVRVRDAVEDDAPRIHALWEDLAADLVKAVGLEPGGTAECQVAAAITRLQDDPGHRIVVATFDSQVVGCAFLTIGRVSPLHEDKAVYVSHLQIDPKFSRHGSGRGLVDACVTWAEQHGIETLMVATALNDRDANRFLAKLGLVQVTVLRATSVSALRSRVRPDPSTTVRNRSRVGRNVGQVVAARRSQRRARDRDPVT